MGNHESRPDNMHRREFVIQPDPDFIENSLNSTVVFGSDFPVPSQEELVRDVQERRLAAERMQRNLGRYSVGEVIRPVQF